ncbi:MAG: hypothetical protein IPK68_03700 [Bdellovibrionales bacterium]|nr:hypothetical protein [Bdellovibrionales bacterium]
MKTFILIAYRNILQRRGRSLMLAGAIFAVTIVFATLLSLVEGVKEAMIGNGTALMTGHLNIAGFYKISQSSANPQVTKYLPLLEYAQTQVPESAIVIDRVKAYGKVISETDSVMIPMWGVTMSQEDNVLARLESESGKVLDLKDRGTIALFKVHAKKLKVDVDDMVTVSVPTYRNMNNTKDLKVVSILKDLGMMLQFTGYMNALDTRELYQSRTDSTGQIMIYLKNLKDLNSVEA